MAATELNEYHGWMMDGSCHPGWGEGLAKYCFPGLKSLQVESVLTSLVWGQQIVMHVEMKDCVYVCACVCVY